MSSQVNALTELSQTNLTLKRFLASVNQLVCFQIIGMFELFGTDLTLKRLLASVHQLMFSQVSSF